MTWPLVFCMALVALTVLGVACIGVVVYWNGVGRYVSDLWLKILIKAIQLISGVVSLFGAYSVGAEKGEWLPAALSGMACVLVWEAVGQILDHRLKAADRIDKVSLERAEFQGKLRTQLLTVFRFAVDGKVRRIRRQLENLPRRFGTPQIRNTLTPPHHLGELLEKLAVFYGTQLPSGSAENRNFRAGVYLNINGVMTPVQCISLNDASYTPFRSYQHHQPAFRLDAGSNSSHVVKCVRQRRMIVVEDCAKAADEGNFTFFTEEQRSYLRSMVVFYLGEVSRENGTMVEGVLVVDTEATGFFTESDAESIEFCLREFGARLRLEMLLTALLASRGANT